MINENLKLSGQLGIVLRDKDGNIKEERTERNLVVTTGLNYIASRRDKVILISFPFPVTTNILLISAEPGLDIEKLAENVVKIFSGDSSGFTKTLADD